MNIRDQPSNHLLVILFLDVIESYDQIALVRLIEANWSSFLERYMLMRNNLVKRIAFAVVILWCVGGVLYLTGLIGIHNKQYPIDKLLPSKMYPTPEAMGTLNHLYAFVAPNGMRKPWKKYYNREEFDILLRYALYPDKKQYDWLINASAIGAMCRSKLPINDNTLSKYEISEMTKVAIMYMKYPESAVRWSAAYLVTKQHLQGAAPKIAEALKTEKNPLVIQEMQDALKACGK